MIKPPPKHFKKDLELFSFKLNGHFTKTNLLMAIILSKYRELSMAKADMKSQ